MEAGLKGLRGAELGQRAILLTPYADQVPALPAFARHFPYIALQRLAPRATAMVHHGGIGTLAQGLRAGLPQLLAPVFFDQFDNAARLETLGLGRRLADPTDAAEMAAALEAMLAAPVRARAADLRGHFGDRRKELHRRDLRNRLNLEALAGPRSKGNVNGPFTKSIPGRRLPSRSNSDVREPVLRVAQPFGTRSGAQ